MLKKILYGLGVLAAIAVAAILFVYMDDIATLVGVGNDTTIAADEGDVGDGSAEGDAVAAALPKPVSCVGKSVRVVERDNVVYEQTPSPHDPSGDLYEIRLSNTAADESGRCVVATGDDKGDVLLADGCLTLKKGIQLPDANCPVRRECVVGPNDCKGPAAATALTSAEPGAADPLDEVDPGLLLRTLTNLNETVRNGFDRLDRRVGALEERVDDAHPAPPSS